MHLGFIATGIKHELEIFEKFWETRTTIQDFTKPDGTKVQIPRQTQLRPVNFYELIFYRPDLDRVLNTMKPELEFAGATAKMNSLTMPALRRAMRYKKIPKPDPKAGIYLFPELHVRTYGIGIREDADLTFDDGSKAEGI